MQKQQTLLIVRHAHRNTSQGRQYDNSLSKKGCAQARRVVRYCREVSKRNSKPVIISSPKKRCVETVESLSSKWNRVQLSDNLDEGGDLAKKCHQICETLIREKRSLVVICSHGDIIPKLLSSLSGVTVELSKGGLIRLNREDNKFAVQAILQSDDLKWAKG